ncbi:hypothetical protein [uncultured Sphingomonas sp.]|uniref:hypothetical protein n=1 Tax=uncultured Sphingomonas sp. TaxID=158754 RepID=UPI0026090F8D|nr:hypothetical protein [uncultured Sphingomonas sp.]
MTVGRDYMLRKGDGPSSPKFFLDTQLVPRLVDAAGSAEVTLDRAARAAGVRPSLLLAGAAGTLAMATTATLRALLKKRRARHTRADAAAEPRKVGNESVATL